MRRAANTPAAISAAADISHQRDAPETATTPRVSITNTSADPRSGCASTNRIGTPAITTASQTSARGGGAARSPRSARIIANPTHSATFASSAGWIEKPGTWIQERDPLIVDPSGLSTSTSPSTAPRYAHGASARMIRESVRMTSTASVTPIAVLMRCRTR